MREGGRHDSAELYQKGGATRKKRVGIRADNLAYRSNPDVDFQPKIKFGGSSRIAGSAKSVCKILMSKSLEVKILRTRNLGRRCARSAHRLGLDHDYASLMGGARSDVTRGLWKISGG
jgi:hypothetical protein